jgi:ribosomal protein L7/L12
MFKPDDPTPAPLPANVVAALARGDAIDAIRLLRESTGLGLKEAKHVIDGHLGRHPAVGATAAARQALSPAVATAMQQGKKLVAIRLLRAETGLGLKEAKDAVEAFESSRKSAAGELAPGQVAPSGRGGWLIAILAALAALGYGLFDRLG